MMALLKFVSVEGYALYQGVMFYTLTLLYPQTELMPGNKWKFGLFIQYQLLQCSFSNTNTLLDLYMLHANMILPVSGKDIQLKASRTETLIIHIITHYYCYHTETQNQIKSILSKNTKMNPDITQICLPLRGTRELTVQVIVCGENGWHCCRQLRHEPMLQLS
jgi:hypothetical protein